jgi:hypothetical protein
VVDLIASPDAAWTRAPSRPPPDVQVDVDRAAAGI